MILIGCPHCGPRVSGEFTFLGDGRAAPAVSPAGIAEWRRHLYFDVNRPGWTTECWIHTYGCNRVVELARHRSTNKTRPSDVDTER